MEWSRSAKQSCDALRSEHSCDTRAIQWTAWRCCAQIGIPCKIFTSRRIRSRRFSTGSHGAQPRGSPVTSKPRRAGPGVVRTMSTCTMPFTVPDRAIDSPLFEDNGWRPQTLYFDINWVDQSGHRSLHAIVPSIRRSNFGYY